MFAPKIKIGRLKQKCYKEMDTGAEIDARNLKLVLEDSDIEDRNKSKYDSNSESIETDNSVDNSCVINNTVDQSNSTKNNSNSSKNKRPKKVESLQEKIARIGVIKTGSCTESSEESESELEAKENKKVKKKKIRKRRGFTFGYDVPDIQTFRPTWQQFQNFADFIDCIEATGAHKAGICRIIPPSKWIPRAKEYHISELGDIVIPAPVNQKMKGNNGLYEQLNIQKKKMTVRELQKLATSSRYSPPPFHDFEHLEELYWQTIHSNFPIYGADVSGTITDAECEAWNINHLGTILDYINSDYGVSIDGVNTAYLYFGMWKATFAWHTEDMDLYSINYLHFGCPKTWYAIPPKHARRFEKIADRYFPENKRNCPAHLRHKMTLISPQILQKHSIPYDTITQCEGEFMITFPYGYHAGFNHGFNCAESTNFATPRWVEYGKRATICKCRPDAVKIGMATFVQRFQPDQYITWLLEEDDPIHPEEPFADSFSERLASGKETDKQMAESTKVSRPRRENKNNKENNSMLDFYYEADTGFEEPKTRRRKVDDDDWAARRKKKKSNKGKQDGRSGAKRSGGRSDFMEDSDNSNSNDMLKKQLAQKKAPARRKSVGSLPNYQNFLQNNDLPATETATERKSQQGETNSKIIEYIEKAADQRKDEQRSMLLQTAQHNSERNIVYEGNNNSGNTLVTPEVTQCDNSQIQLEEHLLHPS